MFSLICSLWERNFTFVVAMILSTYVWATGLFASIPQYAFLDTMLSLWTLLHIFVAASYISTSDAFYKEALLKLHYKIMKPIVQTPMLVAIGNTISTVGTAYLCYYAYNHDEESKATLRAVFAVHTWVASILLQKMSVGLVKLGVDYILNMEKEIEKHDIKTWQAPPSWPSVLIAPFDLILRPHVYGSKNIPTDSPGLYVMNHALFGLEMAPFVATVYKTTHVFLRGLSDHFHFGQLHGEIIRYFGGVNGTRENVDCLMESKHNILVYPGGGHEIAKPCSVPKYSLMWKQRTGFARMAIKHGYPIIPCCSVGTEDMMDRLFDIDLGFFRKGMSVPVIAPIMPHRLQKVYFWVGEPIPTAQYKGEWENDAYATEVRDKVKAAVEAGIKEMKEVQAKDPNRYLINHVGNVIIGIFSGSSTKVKTVEESETCSEPLPESKKAD
jgi:1-acyl-sn-glycerol-3-phosphate acyltransferase